MSYKRKKQDLYRLKKLYYKTHKYSFKLGGAWYNPKKKRYIRIVASNTPGLTKLLRRKCNKRIRKSTEVPNGNAYRKISEYDNLLW